MASFARRVQSVGRAAMAVVVAVGTPIVLADAPQPLTLEQRIEYQRRIERIRWTHRIENVSGQHQPFEETVPEELIRAKVETYLLQGEALARYWDRPLTGAQLQAEMQRMARSTKAPDRLRELHAALDDDPYVIAECLARPVLTERLIRNWYAYDSRWQRGVRSEAEAAIERAQGSVEALQPLGHATHEAVWERGEEGDDADPRVHWLSPAEWDDLVGRLAIVVALPPGTLGRLDEDVERFFVQAVVEKSDARLRVATVTWNKPGFEPWWASARGELAQDIVFDGVDVADGGYRPTAIIGDACVPDTWAPTLDSGPPGHRYSHTAVWTGTEMIVWGGSTRVDSVNAFELVDTGGRYDPATDSWTPTSTGPNVPDPRYRHTAVWTGTEMIVWGGSIRSTDPADTGGRYDPVADSWTPTSTGANVPIARQNHTAVWTGTEMIIWGGDDFTAPQPDDFKIGGRYDPATDSWTQTIPDDHARYSHTAVWTGTEMIVWGGDEQDSIPHLASGGRYDPITDSWTPTSIGANVPTGREWHTAVWTGTEMIVWGGSASSQIDFNDGGRYNPVTDTWTPLSTGANVPAKRYLHTAVWTGTEMIVWGGFASPVGDQDYFNTGGRYDPGTDSWTPTSGGANLPSARRHHTALWTGTEMIVWGGDNRAETGHAFDTGGRYDPATDSWTSTGAGAGVPYRRSRHTALWTGTEMIVWGGGVEGSYSFNTGGRYYPATDSWAPTSTGPNVPTPRDNHTAVWTGTEMIIWSGSYTVSGGRYDPVADSWTPTSTGANVPTGRHSHTAVWTGTEMIVWGGRILSETVNTGGRYDPATDSWTPTSVGANLPSARRLHTAVWTGTEMIVWGGLFVGQIFNTGGRYDASNDSWVPTSTGANVPTTRRDHTAVWTGAEMIVWAGFPATGGPGTGGRYYPATDSWFATGTGPNVPIERYDHTAVWTGWEMIVWGGTIYSGGRYDPFTNDWAATSGANVPPGRRNHTAVWTGTEMIVWGGYPYTSSGGRYCACTVPTTWYRDTDGDGYGDPSVTQVSCVEPPGYLAVAGDCDDTNSATYPGAEEVNDGVDNQCPGDAGYGVADETSSESGFYNPDDKNEYSWPAQPGAIWYQVVRGNTADFSVGCTMFGPFPATQLTDAEPLPSGEIRYYMNRSFIPNLGSWGQDSAGVERTVPCD